MDFILNNIIFLIAIIAGLMSLFKRSDGEDTGPVRTERPTPTTYEKAPKTEDKPSYETVSNGDLGSDTEEVQIDQTNKWYEQLQESRERREQSKTDKNLDKIKQHSLSKKDRQSVQTVSINRNLRSRRLIESLIMSEVIGKPKAKQNR
ncbi:hypothetical protein ACTWQB_08195 [Piscibacillus sp. B03]|uniref:hypothetical protein n=1 Tax=Piscibacillus sp. B03 TaxID=3457430 RepID=UPI003FCD566B